MIRSEGLPVAGANRCAISQLSVHLGKHASFVHVTTRVAEKQYLEYMFWFNAGRRMPVRLTVYTDYALRLLMYLALKDDGLATIAEVAGSYGISKNHLTKVAHQLGVGGYVGTVRGRGGGLRLAKPAEKIGLGEVVRRTEPDLALVPCFSPVDAPCAIRSCCALRRALDKARGAFIEVLDAYTLGDLVRSRTPLRALLAIAPINAMPFVVGRRPSARTKVDRRA
jgi:Rrf2 family nitric oxide-sensitive transcriptional repressor